MEKERPPMCIIKRRPSRGTSGLNTTEPVSASVWPQEGAPSEVEPEIASATSTSTGIRYVGGPPVSSNVDTPSPSAPSKKQDRANRTRVASRNVSAPPMQIKLPTRHEEEADERLFCSSPDMEEEESSPPSAVDLPADPADDPEGDTETWDTYDPSELPMLSVAERLQALREARESRLDEKHMAMLRDQGVAKRPGVLIRSRYGRVKSLQQHPHRSTERTLAITNEVLLAQRSASPCDAEAHVPNKQEGDACHDLHFSLSAKSDDELQAPSSSERCVTGTTDLPPPVLFSMGEVAAHPGPKLEIDLCSGTDEEDDEGDRQY